MTTPENLINPSVEPNSSRGAMLAAIGLWEGTGAMSGGIVGYSLSETSAPESKLNSTIDDKINQIDTKIDAENSALSNLKDARPDTNTAIDSLERTIDGQKHQIQALQQQKENIPSPEHTHGLEFTSAGVVAGMVVAAATWRLFTRTIKKAPQPQK